MGTGMTAGTVSAGLVYDLRFADGSHTQTASAGATYALELWARVSGTNGNTADEKLTNSYVTILSTQASGGAILAGGLADGVRVAPFAGAGSRNGGGADLNADGVIDWGSTSTVAANTNYMFTRTDTVGGELGGTTGQSVSPNTWEWKIASFAVNATAINNSAILGSETRFNIVKPNATSFSVVTYAVSAVDNTTFNVTNQNQNGAYTGSTGVVFVAPVPEPASVGLLGVAAIGLLGRKRRR